MIGCDLIFLKNSFKGALLLNKVSPKELLTTDKTLATSVVHFGNTDDPHDDDYIRNDTDEVLKKNMEYYKDDLKGTE